MIENLDKTDANEDIDVSVEETIEVSSPDEEANPVSAE